MTTTVSIGQASDSAITVLEMRGETSSVKRRVGVQTPLSREFPLGVDSLARCSLRHQPPWPIELERAIELTEDAVMPLARHFSDSTELLLQGSGGSLIARSLDAVGPAHTSITLEEVEILFDRLVSVSEGRPMSQETLPTDVRFFAAVLILREFMHHLHFSKVTVPFSRDQE